MPDWVNNQLNIVGTIEEVKSLYSKIKENGELLNAMVPQPDNLYMGPLDKEKKLELKKEGIPNWYDWNNENWGTKWDVEDLDIDYSEINGKGYISAHFESAWDAPREAYDTFRYNNKDLEVEAYIEEWIEV